MWQSAQGVLVGEDLQSACADAIYQRYVEWWRRHGHGRSTAFFGQNSPIAAARHFAVEHLSESRGDMSVRRMHWARSAEEMFVLVAEEIVRPGVEYHARRAQFDQDRFLQGMQETHTEEDHDVHAWHGHGEGAMALLRPDWLLHGRRVIEEWDDELDGVPVIRRRAERIVPLSDPGMMGHEFNPIVMDFSEDVVFSYDPEHDVIREWHDLWEGTPCTSFRFLSLSFSRVDALGRPYLISLNR